MRTTSRRNRAAFLFAALSFSAGLTSAASAQDKPAPKANDPGSPGDAVAGPRGSSAAVPQKSAAASDAPDGKPKRPKIVLPKLLKFSPAAYPAEAKKQQVEGKVILTLRIDKTGKVLEAKVQDGAGYGFDEAAVQAAKGLLFSPATKDGKPIKARISFRYTFELSAIIKKPDKKALTLGGLEGNVLIGVTKSSLAGATVTFKRNSDGETFRASSDPKGRFRFTELSPGDYTLSIQASGYETLTSKEKVRAGETITVRYRLQLPTANDGVIDVVVEAERPPREVVRRTLQREEIDMIPGTRGDALRSLQSLPGVARPPFLAGLLIVRGSAPQDTITFVDGTDVPLIYHFGGLSSVIPTEVLDKIDFYPGNFSSKYGRAMGGIVDVGLRSPKSDQLHGIAQIDLIDGRAMMEGPVPFTDKKWSFLVAGRRSWIDSWLGPVLEQTGAGVSQAPVYYDYQAILERKLDRGKFRIAFYGSDDAFRIFNDSPPAGEPAAAGELGLHTAFQRFQLIYDERITQRQRIRWMLAFGHDDLDFNIGNFFFNLNVYSFTNRLEYTNKIFKSLSLNAGLDLNGGQALVSLRLPDQPPPGQPPGAPFSTRPALQIDQERGFSRPAGYIEAEWTPTSRLRVVPGLRLDYAIDTGAVDFSPRVNARYQLVKGKRNTTIKAGLGLYHQPPQFRESIEPLGTPGLDSNRATHVGAGVEQDITKQLDVSSEFFYKYYDKLIVGSAAGGFDNLGTGYAFGGEVLLRYKPDKRFFGWLAYTLSRSVRDSGPGTENTLASFDQTHNLTVLGSYKIGAGWTLGARFRLGSGNLTTPNVCDPESSDCDPNRINSVYYAPTGTYIAIPAGSTSSERLPLFHQLDIRADKKWQFKSWALSLYVDIQNVYNNQARESLSYNYNFTERTFVDGLPILPSFGLRGQF
jgi:TonB family protein